MIPGTSHSHLLLLRGLLRPASPLVGGKSKGIGAGDSGTLGPQMPLTPPVHPSTFWSLACPAFQCPAEGTGSGFLILVARRLPSPVAVSKGCRRDKSVPHPGLVAFPGPACLGSQRGKDLGVKWPVTHVWVCPAARPSCLWVLCYTRVADPGWFSSVWIKWRPRQRASVHRIPSSKPNAMMWKGDFVWCLGICGSHCEGNSRSLQRKSLLPAEPERSSVSKVTVIPATL